MKKTLLFAGIAVSGSRDRTAIIWDLSRWTYIKNLPGHAGPVAAVNINELTGTQSLVSTLL